MAFPAFLDTNVLFGQLTCDVLLSLAEQDVFTPYWSARVLDAMERAVVERGHAAPSRIHRRRQLMDAAFPMANVDGFDQLMPAMTNHPGDRHVLAACVTSPAQTLVTYNVKDFPAESLRPYDIEVVHPDQFLMDQFDLHPRASTAALRGMLKRNNRPPQEVPTLVTALTQNHLAESAAWVDRNL